MSFVQDIQDNIQETTTISLYPKMPKADLSFL
uniref:Uncharacterized protein n=1 Tax=Anguilla anguilla TaxID=7936 RepID=A0A0E9PCJ3_ANGAN